MTSTEIIPFEEYAATRLTEQRAEIALRWADAISADTLLPRRRALPASELRESIPEILGCVAEFVRTDEEQVLRGREPVVEGVAALARLRRGQGWSLREMIHELDLLARVLDGACLEWLRTYDAAPSPQSVVRVAGRLNRAPLLMAQLGARAHDAEPEEDDGDHAASRLRELADVLVHELNTPLGAAETAAVLLEDDDIVTNSRERRRLAGMVQRNLRRARTLINDVRDLSLARATHAGVGRWLPLGQVLGTVLARTAELLEAADVRLALREPIPDVCVDAARVELILANLISNAAKYADAARPVRQVVIHFERDAAAGMWWACVSDNGIGIAPAHHGRVFQRFFRAHPEHAEGTGLGLAIVREAVRQMGGRIVFDSEPGVGSVFRFSFPDGAGAGVPPHGA